MTTRSFPYRCGRAARCGLLGALAACAPASLGGGPAPAGRGSQVVVLERVNDRAPERWSGMTNVFFDAVPDSLRRAARVGDGWGAVEFARLVEGQGLAPVWIARFREPGTDRVLHVVDTSGQLDFTHGLVLAFERRGDFRVADFDLTVRSTAGRAVPLPFQVLLSGDGYTYARIAEYRVGRLRVGGRDYAVRVRSASRNRPFTTLGPGSVFLVDVDGDGVIVEQPAVTGEGRPLAAEQVMPGAPFMLGGRVLQLAAVDSLGAWIAVRPSPTRVAAVEGFRAPDLRGETPDGAPFSWSRGSGAVTLIEFWSVNCAFSERARAAANALAAEMRDAGLAFLAVSRERDGATVTRHLADHPVAGAVVLPDSATWATWNPAGITPFFVVVDRGGVVRFRAAGALAMEAVAAEVRTLVGR